jgi:ferric-dicitrate binding protein FerR (iron transport regulator)
MDVFPGIKNLAMDRLQILFSLYTANKASDAEVSEMLLLMRSRPAEEVKALLEAGAVNQTGANTEAVDWNAMWTVIGKEIETGDSLKTPVSNMQSPKRWWAIAAVLLLVISGVYWLAVQPNKRVPDVSKTASLKHDVAPGSTGAVLTLPGGKTIVLDTASNGLLAVSDHASIRKGSDGVSVVAGNSNTMEYATLTTTPGRTQNMTLSDGTRVWLNAGSSIYFPVAFSGKERTVTITGEVYFEVTENAASPFRINVGDAVMEVLGTHFNINAYEDEKIVRTTLLTGSLKVTKGTSSGILKPGQQASFIPNDVHLAIKDEPSAFNTIAWINGFFHFEKAGIHTVMRQIARWYDVEIAYKGDPTTDLFGGDMQRNLPLSSVLKALEKSQVHFKIEGRKLVVMP